MRETCLSVCTRPLTFTPHPRKKQGSSGRYSRALATPLATPNAMQAAEINVRTSRGIGTRSDLLRPSSSWSGLILSLDTLPVPRVFRNLEITDVGAALGSTLASQTLKSYRRSTRLRKNKFRWEKGPKVLRIGLPGIMKHRTGSQGAPTGLMSPGGRVSTTVCFLTKPPSPGLPCFLLCLCPQAL